MKRKNQTKHKDEVGDKDLNQKTNEPRSPKQRQPPEAIDPLEPQATLSRAKVDSGKREHESPNLDEDRGKFMQM